FCSNPIRNCRANCRSGASGQSTEIPEQRTAGIAHSQSNLARPCATGRYAVAMSTTTTPKSPAFKPPPPSPQYLATQTVAQRLTALCSAGKNQKAMQELYADNARHVEAMEAPGCPRITEGKATLLQKAEKFAKTTQIHGASCSKPLINGDQ